MHAFFRKDDRVDVVYHVLVPVPWLQAGVENVAVGPCPPPQAVRRRLWVSSTGSLCRQIVLCLEKHLAWDPA